MRMAAGRADLSGVMMVVVTVIMAMLLMGAVHLNGLRAERRGTAFGWP